MRLIIIKSLFVKDNESIKINTDSITSLFYFIDNFTKINHRVLIDIKIIGWAIPDCIDKMKNILDNYAINAKALMNTKFDYKILDNNYGKMMIIKTSIDMIKPIGSIVDSSIDMIKPIESNIDSSIDDKILYMDHDIIIGDKSGMEILLTSAYDDLIDKKINVSDNKDFIIKIMSPSQLIDNRHNYIAFMNTINIENHEFNYSTDNSHIASGCFVTNYSMFVNISKLKSDQVYGDEDMLIGELLNKNNWLNIISPKAYVIHPKSEDDNYNLWKTYMILTAAHKRS